MEPVASPMSYDTCYYSYPAFSPVSPVACGRNYGGFALIVVLFILLIIIGATCYCK
ncbi:YjcZ family sporulation protein [Niallia sp. XMNu-256]|uniref:YjcZ family sporulation protein n=1 Tax=Niallia sp. XMNu-256 TaxID=3082444 RepID=UPI0030D46060